MSVSEQQHVCSAVGGLEPVSKGTYGSLLPATTFGCSLGTGAR